MVKKKLLALGLVALSLTGCNCIRTEYSHTMYERGIVKEMCYVPAGHGSGSGTGISMNGDLSITYTTVYIPARYAVVFGCEHGSFVVTNNDAIRLYQTLSEGDSVDIAYRILYNNTYNKHKELISSQQVDLDFIDASPRSSMDRAKDF